MMFNEGFHCAFALIECAWVVRIILFSVFQISDGEFQDRKLFPGSGGRQFFAVGQIFADHFFVTLTAGFATVFAEVDKSTVEDATRLAGRFVLEVAGKIISWHLGGFLS